MQNQSLDTFAAQEAAEQAYRDRVEVEATWAEVVVDFRDGTYAEERAE